ncbi:MAG: hypothetical protein AAF543_06460 [Pseudomonadota bacterium]
MTIKKTGWIAAFGLLALGLAAPASAGVPVTAAPVDGLAAAAGVQEITDRGSWVEPRTRWRRDHRFGLDRGYDRYDGHHHRKHFKKKKRRKIFKRGYRRGYDEGYYEGRRHSRFERRRRHHHHHYYPDYRFGGGFYFGDGHYSGGGFRFRY